MGYLSSAGGRPRGQETRFGARCQPRSGRRAAECASPILYLGGARRRNGRMGVRISDVESVRLLDEGAAWPKTITKQIAARALRGERDWPPAALVAAAGCRRRSAGGAGWAAL